MTKILNPLLDTVSNLPIKNFGDLLNKINNLNMENIFLAGLDIKSFYTNIPVCKYMKCSEIHIKKTNNNYFHLERKQLEFAH